MPIHDAAKQIGIEDVPGVDFGIVNLACDSTGHPYTGPGVGKVRQKLSRRRAGLRRCGTRAVKRKLKELSGNEAGVRKHTNLRISKES